MTRRVYKYEMRPCEGLEVTLPAGAEVLSFGIQHGTFVLWAAVDPSYKPTLKRTYEVVGDGWDLPEGNLIFRATVTTDQFVWHIFERA